VIVGVALSGAIDILVNELAKQKKKIIEELEKMKMPISQADKDLAKGTEESGIFRVFLNEACLWVYG